ncbi:MAG: hypothetical protein ACRDP9_02560 [Kribbellaceae bacterium]
MTCRRRLEVLPGERLTLAAFSRAEAVELLQPARGRTGSAGIDALCYLGRIPGPERSSA